MASSRYVDAINLEFSFSGRLAAVHSDQNYLQLCWLVHTTRRVSKSCCLHAGPYDPNDPNALPPQAPSAWQHMLHVVGGIMHFFGRLSFLVDENAHAVHFFVSALLQLLDR